MVTDQEIDAYYAALVRRDPTFEGTFFAAIKTTGIFCRPTCPARKPRIENCEFFRSAQEALLAGYRPCKRCRPLSLPNSPSNVVRMLIEAVEARPEKRWREADFRRLGIDPSTVRRQFKNRFGMTFVAYARARRMGIAMKIIRDGDGVVSAQIGAGYRSGSGFRDAFSRIMGTPPGKGYTAALKAEWIDTPLGPMVAIADEHALHLLEYTDRRGLEREVERLRAALGAPVLPGRTSVTDAIERELGEYFAGTLRRFSTPLFVRGTTFQRCVWEGLRSIPYGETRSYAQQAVTLGNPAAVRAVARANGANRLALVIPCHRVIGADGKLVGYGGGLIRKRWLLDLERRHR